MYPGLKKCVPTICVFLSVLFQERVNNFTVYMFLFQDGTITKPNMRINLGFSVYYETIKRELCRRLMYECRCDERLKSTGKGSTLLVYTNVTRRVVKRGS